MNTLVRHKIRAILFFACLAILIFLAIRFFAVVREGNQNVPTEPAGIAEQKSSVEIRGTETRAVSENNLVLPTITYREHRFAPITTALEQNASSTGCVIQVTNQSNAPLIIRLSPHEKALKGNHGGQYDPVPPKGSIIIDPRFDLGYVSFHNHAKPSEEFHVRIGNSCRSDL